MKSLTLLLTTLFLFSSPVVWGEEIRYEDLVERGGLYYKKFSEEPFTGNIVGTLRGKVVKGKPEGKWTEWWSNGQLRKIAYWKNGKKEGLSEGYYESGELWWRVNYKNGLQEGLDEMYRKNGESWMRGHWKNDKKVGKWEYFKEDGTLNYVIDCDVENCRKFVD